MGRGHVGKGVKAERERGWRNTERERRKQGTCRESEGVEGKETSRVL